MDRAGQGKAHLHIDAVVDAEDAVADDGAREGRVPGLPTRGLTLQQPSEELVNARV